MANQGLAAGFVPATQTVQLPGGGGFTVRGLSLADITVIYRHHAGELGLWFDHLQDSGQMDGDTAAVLINGMLSSAPLVATAVIASAADVTEPAAIASLLQMPVAVQFDAIMKIGELTFTPEMPPKKLIGIVMGMLPVRPATPET